MVIAQSSVFKTQRKRLQKLESLRHKHCPQFAPTSTLVRQQAFSSLLYKQLPKVGMVGADMILSATRN
jgi:hypothetical protein